MRHGGRHSGAKRPIDELGRESALSAMLASHGAALDAVASAQGKIDEAAGQIALALSTGRTLHYVAAGSSALMALADACELPGTFGITQSQIRIWMAGGVPVDGVMPGDVEDEVDGAAKAAQAMASDDVCVAVSASGTTPYTLSFARAAKARGNTVIAVANVTGSPLLDLADVAIALPTGPEVVEGSTRLGAGTAQKVALNMLSTQAGILLGHVHSGFMVNLVADNIKLRKRASRIVAQVAGVTENAADTALRASSFDTKLAVLVASGVDMDVARQRLEKADGHLRKCLSDHAQNENNL